MLFAENDCSVAENANDKKRAWLMPSAQKTACYTQTAFIAE